jgi:REP element-mobilizing transposase RayT
MPGLQHHARESLRNEPIRITAEMAQVLLEQFRETATFRGWQLLGVAVLSNHVHLVVGVQGDPDPTKLLGDFKAYGSRALNRRWGKPPCGTWWTYAGSKRKLADSEAVRRALEYLRRQPGALLIWFAVDPAEL